MRLLLIILLSLELLSSWDEVENFTELNSSSNDFAPSFNSYEGLLYFSSDRTGNSLIYKLDNKTVIELKGGINSTSKNQFYISFASEKKAIFGSFRNYDRQSFQNLFESNYQKQSWKKGKLIQELSKSTFVSHPTVSADGSQLIYVSSSETDIEDTDLYISYRNSDGSWGKPLSLEEINSPGKEITPFLKGSDSLFFASDGQGGQGGFDIFLSVKELGVWQRPIPIIEINGPYNDSDPTLNNDDDLIFCSDRPGGVGGLDIYISKSKKLDTISRNDPHDDLKIDIESYISDINLQISKKTENYIPDPFFEFSVLGNIKDIDRFKEYLSMLDDHINGSNETVQVMIGDPKMQTRVKEQIKNLGFDRPLNITFSEDLDDLSFVLLPKNDLLISKRMINSSLVAIPDKLEINLKGQNLNKIKTYSVTITMNKDQIYNSEDIIFVNEKLSIDIAPFIEKLANGSEFDLQLKFNSYNGQLVKNKTFYLANQITLESNKKEIDGQNYHCLSFSDNNDLFELDNFSTTLKDLCKFSKGNVILHYGNGKLAAAELVSKRLSEINVKHELQLDESINNISIYTMSLEN